MTLKGEMQLSIEAALTDLDLLATLTPPAAITNYANETGGNLGTLVAQINKLAFDAGSNLKVSLLDALSSAYDSIDVNKMSPAATITVLNAVTSNTTSSEINCSGYRSAKIEEEITAAGSGTTWQPSITSSEVSGGTFGTFFKEVAGVQTVVALPISTASSTGKRTFTLVGALPNFLKITETLAGTGTVTVKVTLFN